MSQEKFDIASLERVVGYAFEDQKNIETALTHSSYANECKSQSQCNERQEFLGDAVLSVVVSDYLFGHFHLPEGELTKLRASVVCEQALCGFSREIGLGNYLRLGKGEIQTGGAERPSILADAFEALIAAIYLDGGMEPARNFVVPFVERMLEGNIDCGFRDYKTMLQEIVQQNPEETVSYVLVDECGPDHNKQFTVEVHLNSNVIGTGTGRSKKIAEQNAAREALALMGR